MATTEAIEAMEAETAICAGAPGTDDHDEGRIIDMTGDSAEVSWGCAAARLASARRHVRATGNLLGQ